MLVIKMPGEPASSYAGLLFLQTKSKAVAKITKNIHPKYIAYVRVSTQKQGRSGLGLEAQKEIIRYNVKDENIIAWYEEVQSGKDIEILQELQKAKDHAKRDGFILVIAKADRLRNTQQALDLVDEMTPERVFFCNVGRNADKFTLTLFFAFAEKERLEISIRTKAALARLKARGVKLGRWTHKDFKLKSKKLGKEQWSRIQKIRSKAGAEARRMQSLNDINNKTSAKVSLELRKRGKTYKEIAVLLNSCSLTTMTGGKWYPGTVCRLINKYKNVTLEEIS